MSDEEVGEAGYAGDNTDVTTQSGCGRFCNSIFTAICVAPLVILIMCAVLGWNERRAVCDQRAIAQGQEEVLESGCNAVEASGKLVMFQCDLQSAGLPTFTATGDFAAYLSFQGVGMKTKAEIYQCVEESSSSTKKNSVGGGTTTVTTYTYRKKWSESYIDSSNFRKKSSESFRVNCGVENINYPPGAPATDTKLATFANVGPYKVPKSSFLEKVPLTDPLFASSTPSGWQRNGNEYTLSPGSGTNIGDVKVSFYGNDMNSTRMTVLGNNEAGVVSRWTASDSWLCSGFTLAELRMGNISKDDLFASMAAAANMTTWVIRFIALIVLWMGCCCIFKPLEVAADCIPFIGPYLGDSISCIISCVTCPLACACGLGVAGAVWVVMRPPIGIAMMVVFCLCFGSAIAFKVYAQSNKDEGGGPAENQS